MREPSGCVTVTPVITSKRRSLAEEWLSQSRIKLGAKCLFAYQIVHVDQLTRRWSPGPLQRGTLVHRAYEAALLWDWAARHLEAFGDEGPAVSVHLPDSHLHNMLEIGERALREQMAEWLNDPDVSGFLDEHDIVEAGYRCNDAVKIFRRSFSALGVHTGEWETVAAPNGQPFIEYNMSVPYPGWAGFRGTLDWVAKDRRGHVWLWDFKTRKAIQGPDYDRLQIQAPCYQFLLRETLGVELVGTVTYQIRAAVRQEPTLNKTATKQPNGIKSIGMSRKVIATDQATYRASLEKNGLNPLLYLDMLDKLPVSFDRVDRFYRGPHEIEAIWQTVQDLVINIREAHRTQRYPRNINPFNCRGCSHRKLCEADLHAEDVDSLIAAEYLREGEKQVPQPVYFDEEEIIA